VVEVVVIPVHIRT